MSNEHLGLFEERQAMRAMFARCKPAARTVAAAPEPVPVQPAPPPRPRPIRVTEMPPVPNRPGCPVPSGNVTARQVLNAVARAYGVTAGDLQCSERTQRLARPRFACVALLRAKRGMSYPQIGFVLGKRDHTTVMWALRRARGLMGHDPDWTERYRTAELLLFGVADPLFPQTGNAGPADSSPVGRATLSEDGGR